MAKVVISLFALLIVAAVAGLVWASLPENRETARSWAPIASPFLTVASLATALLVAWVSWLSPFTLDVLARPFVWRLGPIEGQNRALDIVFWTTLANTGARSGSVDDLAVELILPKTRWLFQPIAFVRSDDYFQTQFGRRFEFPPVEGPFTPLFLTGRSQITKAVLFVPSTGDAKDFDSAFVVAGTHEVRLYARARGKSFALVSVQKIVFDPDVVAAWKAGQTVGGMVNHRDRPTRELLPR